jgi:L-aspartate oxidase
MELAPRDVVSRAIDAEMQQKGVPHVFLDCRHLDMESFLKHFPNIYEKCLSQGIDLSKELIPVVPAAHYVMGGIQVNKNGATSITRLFASGEVSCTGLHGANRLASNSLLEALVYSHHIYAYLAEQPSRIPEVTLPPWNDKGVKEPKELAIINQLRSELQQLMSNYAAIVRSNHRLKKAQKRIDIIWEETEYLYKTSKLSVPICELRNMVGVAHLVIAKSMEQKQNAGGFYNKDLDV